MTTTRFQQMIAARKALGFHVCVGLDTEWDRIPECVKKKFEGEQDAVDAAISEFNTEIALATADLACAFKPNWAFYEGMDLVGEAALADSMWRINKNSPELPFIVDRKAADIGNTNRGTVSRVFDKLEAEAMTISPYMGYEDSMDSFLKREDKYSFVLCLTSNKGANELQKRQVEVTEDDGALYDRACEFGGKKRQFFNEGRLIGEFRTVPLYVQVAWKAVHDWNKHGNCGLVVGATHPAELENICRIVAGTGILLLIPGSKTQGGRLEDIIPILKRTGCMDQAIINLSRDIIYASAGDDFAEAAQKKLLSVNAEIDRLLNS